MTQLGDAPLEPGLSPSVEPVPVSPPDGASIPIAKRCEPSPEHRQMEWHWVQLPKSLAPVIRVWHEPTCRWTDKDWSAAAAARDGWVYLMPAFPPRSP